MSDHLIFDENSLYELDEECLKKKGKERKEEEKKEEKQEKRKHHLSAACDKRSNCCFERCLFLLMIFVCMRK